MFKNNSTIAPPPDARLSNNWNKKAFTLAEILITLGIVGIIAALITPTLTANIRRAELKNRFKKMDSIVSRGILNTVQELGYNSFNDMDIPANTPNSEVQSIYDNYNSIFLSQFKIIKSISICNDQQGKKPIKNYFLEDDAYRKYCWAYGNDNNNNNNNVAYILSDGSSISVISYAKDTSKIMPQITIDTNGPYKGPNANGYDLFTIKSELNEKRTSGMLCAPLAQTTANLSGCYWFAHKDTSSLNNLNYWDVLYHKRDYWEKLKNK